MTAKLPVLSTTFTMRHILVSNVNHHASNAVAQLRTALHVSPVMLYKMGVHVRTALCTIVNIISTHLEPVWL